MSDLLAACFLKNLSKLAGRPIPLDKEKLLDVAVKLLGDLSVDSSGFFIGKSTATIKEIDMKGQSWDVYVRLLSRPEIISFEGHPKSSAYGSIELDTEKHMANITIVINDYNLAQLANLMEVDFDHNGVHKFIGANGKYLNNEEYGQLYRASLAEVHNTLIHEITHLKDPVTQSMDPKDYISLPDPSDENKSLEEELTKKHFSQPVEMRAWMQELIHDLNHLLQPGDELYDVLDRSRIWHHLQDKLDDNAKKQMLQAAYTWFTESTS